MKPRHLLAALPALLLCTGLNPATARQSNQASHQVIITVQKTHGLIATPRLVLQPMDSSSRPSLAEAAARTDIDVRADGNDIRLSAGLLTAWDEQVHLHLFGSEEPVDLDANIHRELVAGPLSLKRVEMEYNAPMWPGSVREPDAHKRSPVVALTLTAN